MENNWDVFISKNEQIQKNNILDGRISENISDFNYSFPQVSTYLANAGFKPIYPNDKKYAVCLSHDIDLLYSNTNYKDLFLNTLRRLKVFDIKTASEDLFDFIPKNKMSFRSSPQRLIELNQKFNQSSSFYFLAIDSDEQDYNYQIDEIKELASEIIKSGSEIGLHGSHTAFNDPDKIKSEKAKLEDVIGIEVKGYRNHYLKFSVPETWSFLEQNNFLYDTTYGYYDAVGFRNGMCHPFNPYINDSFSNIYEIPLIQMDVSFWRYMKLSLEDMIEKTKEQIDKVKAVNGVYTLLWHNTELYGWKKELYQEILNIIHFDEDAWVTTNSNLLQYWDKQKYNEEMNAILLGLKNSNN